MANNKFVVPEHERHDFNLLVQRANRRLKANLKFMQKEEITDFNTQHALLGIYANPEEWATQKNAFSRSTKFASKQMYEAYKKHLSKWGGEGPDYEKSIENIKEGYYKAIIQSLTVTALDNGDSILTSRGKLPGNLAKKIKGLSLTQLTNFFEIGDPSEDIEASRFNSLDYLGVDREEFVSVTETRLNYLKQIYPSGANDDITVMKSRAKKNKKKAKSRKKKKRKARKSKR